MANKRHKLVLSDGFDSTAMGVLSSQLSPMVDDGSIAVGDTVQLSEYTASIVANNVCLVIVDLKHIARPEAPKVCQHVHQPPRHWSTTPLRLSSARLPKTLPPPPARPPAPPRLPSCRTPLFKPPTTSPLLTTQPHPPPCAHPVCMHVAHPACILPQAQAPSGVGQAQRDPHPRPQPLQQPVYHQGQAAAQGTAHRATQASCIVPGVSPQGNKRSITTKQGEAKSLFTVELADEAVRDDDGVEDAPCCNSCVCTLSQLAHRQPAFATHLPIVDSH